MGSTVIYRTSDEVHYIKDLYARNRSAFFHTADLILGDKRTYEGEGMSVNVRLLKNIIRDLIARHKAELIVKVKPRLL